MQKWLIENILEQNGLCLNNFNACYFRFWDTMGREGSTDKKGVELFKSATVGNALLPNLQVCGKLKSDTYALITTCDINPRQLSFQSLAVKEEGRVTIFEDDKPQRTFMINDFSLGAKNVYFLSKNYETFYVRYEGPELISNVRVGLEGLRFTPK